MSGSGGTAGLGRPQEAQQLVAAIERERALLDDLKSALDRQRAAVAADDVEGIEQGVHAVHRVLFTLSEASARRRGIVRMLGGREDARLGELAELLGTDAPPQLLEALRALSGTAGVVQEALELTRQVLRGAAETGDALIKRLSGADTPGDGYPGGATRRAGALLNREV